MKKGWYGLLGFGLGVSIGWYVNSELEYSRFFDIIEDQVQENAANLEEKPAEKPKAKLSGSLELSVIGWDKENSEVTLIGDDGKEYVIEYAKSTLKGSIYAKKDGSTDQ